MKKLSIIGGVVLAAALVTGCASKATVANNRIYDDNSLKIGKKATATNQYKIIVGEERVRFDYGTANNDDYKLRKMQTKRLKKLSRKEAEELVLQEAVIELGCALIVEPNYKYDMRGKKVVGITVVGYPGKYDFGKDDVK